MYDPDNDALAEMAMRLAKAQRELREVHLAIKAAKPELAALLAMPGLPVTFFAPIRKLLAQL